MPLNVHNIPKHIAIIMDGNGRWAKERGEDRIFGHHKGVLSVRKIVEACIEFKVEYLTLYAFSTENWNRPKHEVDALMELLVHTLKKEIESLHEKGIKLFTIGNIKSLPAICQQELDEAKKLTENNSTLNLVLALSYSAQEEILEATKKIAEEHAANLIHLDSLSPEMFSKYLSTKDIPNPELLIRTSGENRISNFLLYQIAYSELYFTPTHWPDFDKEKLTEALIDYQLRERRFGKTSEQIQHNETIN